MGAMASQITSLTIVYSTVYLGVDQRKHQSSALLAFVRGIQREPVNSPHKWLVTRKMFPFDDVIMRCGSNHQQFDCQSATIEVTWLLVGSSMCAAIPNHIDQRIAHINHTSVKCILTAYWHTYMYAHTYTCMLFIGVCFSRCDFLMILSGRYYWYFTRKGYTHILPDLDYKIINCS